MQLVTARVVPVLHRAGRSAHMQRASYPAGRIISEGVTEASPCRYRPSAVVEAGGDVQRTEGKTGLLLVGLIALVFVALPLFIRYGGADPGPLAPIPEDPVAVLEGGQKVAFAAGDLTVGDGLLCQSQGLNVGAWVPKPGHTTRAHVVGPFYTASIQIRTRDDGVVIARCA